MGSGSKPAAFRPVLDHAQAAVGHDGAAERLVGLQPDDDFVVAVDVAGRMASSEDGVLASTSSTPFFHLLLEIGLQLRPDRLRALRDRG